MARTNNNNRSKRALPLDVQIGNDIRALRTMRNMSQEELALGLGLTFQQIQKYEKGANRITAGRLAQIAGVLKVSPAHFFGDGDARLSEDDYNLFRMIRSPDAARLMQAFAKLKRVDRTLVVHVAEALEARR